MSLHWPEELRFLTYVVGQAWPDGDEDRMFAMAQAWLTAAEDLEQQVLPVLRTAEGRTLNGYESGAGREQIRSALHQLQAGDHSVERLVADFRQVGGSTRNAATTLEATKLMTIFATTMLAAQIAGAWLWPPTAPAVEAAAIGATRASLYRVSNRALAALGNLPHVGEYLVKTLRYLPRLTDEPGRIAGLVAKYPTALTAKATPGLFKAFVDAGFRASTARTLAGLPADAVQFLISKATNNLIWAGGLDATIQGIQMSKGHRDEFNATQFGMSVAASTGGWYAGALVATNVSKYGARFLTSRGKDPTAGVWGAGLGTLSGTVPTVVATLVGGGIAMGFTGSFDPTMGLIGALASNSLIGTPRGYIGMRGQEPAATRTDDVVAQSSPTPSSLRASGDSPATSRPLASSDELISQVRARDDQGYQAARAQDRAASREATPESGPVNRRAHRDAHVSEQRSQIKELADARRAVLDAELQNVRARDRAAATPDDPAALDSVVQTRLRMDEAVGADAAVRARIQNRLESDHQQGGVVETELPLPTRPSTDIEQPLPSRSSSDGEGAVTSSAGHRDSADDGRAIASVRSQADSETVDSARNSEGNLSRGADGSVSARNSDGSVSAKNADSSASARNPDESIPARDSDLSDSAKDSDGSNADRNASARDSDGGDSTDGRASNSGARTQGEESEIRAATPTGSGHDRRSSNTDSADNVAARNDIEHSPGSATRAEDPTVATLRSKMAAADAHITTLRETDSRVDKAYKSAVGKGLNDLVEQRGNHRSALADLKTAREATNTDLRQARIDHDSASVEQQPALRQRINDLESTLKTQDRAIEDQSAHLAVVDQQVTRTSADLDAALSAREHAMADARRSMTELEDAGRAAAAANAARPDRTGTAHAFADNEQLQRDIDQRRTELDSANADYEELALASGAAERKLERQLADFDTSIRTERTMLDGGYMSGKPKSRKLPLDHGMPDPFTALPPPAYDFWRYGGTR
ncbi:hypothetical protein NONI108955_43600 [Nocardia ninae]|uniref:Outer membrane channel protein CpnT-like N-terminal domain-containing protein n=1 Tax=Nocardia ninae NBRC 108245 TaxID=1210091 RepID=A0A511M7W6_9NOCA|nr:hypothetical protein [Nocardia ninae]GEM36745.1 hypothetical protein NN4_12640 [Nocardia ninae NBRC 108245]